MHVRLHHHREQRLIDSPEALQQRGKERAGAQLADATSTSPAAVVSSRCR
jgi:hypothetical protein